MSSVPVPPEPSAEVGSVASVVGDADADSPDPVAAAEGSCGLGEALDDADLDGVLRGDPLDESEDEAVVPPEVAEVVRGALVVPRGVPVVGRGVDEVVRGVEVAFGAVVAGFGVDVAVAAGGAMLGGWPEPKRKPMTLPAGGS